MQQKMKDNFKINILTKKDLDFSYFCGSGAGGQRKNKVKSGVQIKHKESGSMGRADEDRSLERNKKRAFIKMTNTPKFKVWLSKVMFKIRNEESIEDNVKRELADPRNVVYKVKGEDGKWIEVKEDYFENHI